jgi:heme-degrading monooxygenase HmoA
VVNVTVNNVDAALAALDSQVVPQVSGSPGFVAGYWVRLDEHHGTSVTVYESEDAAQAAAQQLPPGEFVTFDSVKVGEVVASA